LIREGRRAHRGTPRAPSARFAVAFEFIFIGQSLTIQPLRIRSSFSIRRPFSPPSVCSFCPRSNSAGRSGRHRRCISGNSRRIPRIRRPACAQAPDRRCAGAHRGVSWGVSNVVCAAAGRGAKTGEDGSLSGATATLVLGTLRCDRPGSDLAVEADDRGAVVPDTGDRHLELLIWFGCCATISPRGSCSCRADPSVRRGVRIDAPR